MNQRQKDQAKWRRNDILGFISRDRKMSFTVNEVFDALTALNQSRKRLSYPVSKSAIQRDFKALYKDNLADIRTSKRITSRGAVRALVTIRITSQGIKQISV